MAGAAAADRASRPVAEVSLVVAAEVLVEVAAGYASHNRIEAHRKMRSPPYGGLFYFYPATTGIWNS